MKALGEVVARLQLISGGPPVDDIICLVRLVQH
eukprot:SAG31_NODE_41046_length_278_cov_0.569832_2_plen_32_part_01